MITSLILVSVPDLPPDLIALALTIMTDGSVLGFMAFLTPNGAIDVPARLLLQVLSVPGWFLPSLAAVTSGVIDDSPHPLWHRAQRRCLGPFEWVLRQITYAGQRG